MPDLVLAILGRMSLSAGGALLTQLALSFLVMIVPTTIMGATFPCAVQICARALPRLGRDIGQVYSANTGGTIAGALLAGFLLVPWLGLQVAMMAAAAMNVAVGGMVLVASTPALPAWRRAAVAPLILLFLLGMVFLPRWDRRVMVGGVSIYVQKFVGAADPAALFRQEAAARQLLFYREGINSTVAVERTERMTSLKVDGKVDASNGADMLTQLMLGHLPLFLHPRPERVLVIGLGSGVTAGAVAQHPVVREIDVVELEPAVVEASSFFVQENRGVLRDPRVRVVIADGRNFILASGKRYDVIVI
jgi:predicted membrane-bound spermidine synthase